ncbi:unnamed protein product [Darwinula stevensoni]|uniref:Uncharacterized protein n=1 Tax=Darwinula stevensoni TaxID=69355 RepID=A0A7R8X6C3_9CRUS|nr:unnamed protein product [Darwinula stevensoni]CAG0881120.1 unnamed protein product [Darwinula stevensoni]
MGGKESKEPVKTISVSSAPLHSHNRNPPVIRLDDSEDLDEENFIIHSDLGESLDLRRGTSLVPTSAISTDSTDSGVFDELDEEYGHVITEKSSPELVAQVERDFVPPQHLDLTIYGNACRRLLSGSQRVRMEESQVLNLLREEGLLATNPTKGAAGLSFEIVDAGLAEGQGNDLDSSSSSVKLPPLRLLQSQEPRKNVTNSKITEKLEKAEERRKAAEEEKLKRLNMEKKQEASQRQQQSQVEKVEKYSSRVDAAQDNRYSSPEMLTSFSVSRKPGTVFATAEGEAEGSTSESGESPAEEDARSPRSHTDSSPGSTVEYLFR